MSVFKKIHLVMQDVEYLQKDDKVSFGNTSYKAISEEKVTQAIRKSMVKHGLVIIPIEQEHHKEAQLTTVNTKYLLVDVETGDSVVAVSSGTGADTQDKGVGKAMTYAYKYLLLRTFAIPTGEDPDKVSSEELDSKFKQTPIKQEPTTPKADGLASDGQVKMMGQAAVNCGYKKEDKDALILVMNSVLGRNITKLGDVMASEVDKVMKFLSMHKKTV